MFAKIYVPNVVAYLSWTPIFEWYAIWWGSKNNGISKNMKVKAQICCISLWTYIIWDIRMSSKNDEESGYGLDVDVANDLIPIACLMS